MLRTPSKYGLKIFINGFIHHMPGPCTGYALTLWEVEEAFRKHVRDEGTPEDIMDVFTKDPDWEYSDDPDGDGFTVFAYRISYIKGRTRTGYKILREKVD